MPRLIIERWFNEIHYLSWGYFTLDALYLIPQYLPKMFAKPLFGLYAVLHEFGHWILTQIFNDIQTPNDKYDEIIYTMDIIPALVRAYESRPCLCGKCWIDHKPLLKFNNWAQLEEHVEEEHGLTWQDYVDRGFLTDMTWLFTQSQLLRGKVYKPL